MNEPRFKTLEIPMSSTRLTSSASRRAFRRLMRRRPVEHGCHGNSLPPIRGSNAIVIWRESDGSWSGRSAPNGWKNTKTRTQSGLLKALSAVPAHRRLFGSVNWLSLYQSGRITMEPSKDFSKKVLNHFDLFLEAAQDAGYTPAEMPSREQFQRWLALPKFVSWHHVDPTAGLSMDTGITRRSEHISGDEE